VIYTGTFSKVFSPIVRLGYIVVPKALSGSFREERLSHGAPPSLMAQPALAEFMSAPAPSPSTSAACAASMPHGGAR
jgi:GntR family transcriptional regulator / MocR family aminotransferase